MKIIDTLPKKFCIIIAGPTGTGKSDFALQLAQQIPVEIINADIGSFYTPLTIGTAKPDWKKETTPHHFFDIIDEPVDWTAPQFRLQLAMLIEQIIARGNVPVIVGGSAFYVQSFFYKNKDIVQPNHDLVISLEQKSSQELWKELFQVDPQRAEAVGKTDHYRLVRALSIWHSCQEKPSQLRPIFDPLYNFYCINLSRDRDQLYAMIDQRVLAMIDHGWIDEVRFLSNDLAWVDFLLKKKMIGYDLLLNYLQGNFSEHSFEQVINTIQQRTRNYAKRQITFLKKMMQLVHDQVMPGSINAVVHHNLTHQSQNDALVAVLKDMQRLRQN